MTSEAKPPVPETYERLFVKPRTVCYLQAEDQRMQVNLLESGSFHIQTLSDEEVIQEGIPVQQFSEGQQIIPVEVYSALEVRVEPSIIREHPISVLSLYTTNLLSGDEEERRVELGHLATVFTDTSGLLSVYGDGVQQEQIVALHMPIASSTTGDDTTSVYSLFFPYKDIGNRIRRSSTDGFQLMCEMLANETKKIIQAGGDERLQRIMDNILGRGNAQPNPEVDRLHQPRRALYESVIMMTLYRASVAEGEKEARAILQTLFDIQQVLDKQESNVGTIARAMQRFKKTQTPHPEVHEVYSLRQSPAQTVAHLLTPENLAFNTAESKKRKPVIDTTYRPPQGLELPENVADYKELDTVRSRFLTTLPRGFNEEVNTVTRPYFEMYAKWIVELCLQAYDATTISESDLARLMVALEELESSSFARNSSIEYRNQRQDETKMILTAQRLTEDPIAEIKDTGYLGVKDSRLDVIFGHIKRKLNEKRASLAPYITEG